MRTLVIFLLCTPFLASAQIGIKGGYNFSNVTSASGINAGNHAGYNVAIFLAPPSKSIISSHTEIEFSRQGYSFSNGTTSGNVNLNYLIIPQFMAINITKFVQIQLGIQMAFLLNAKADSTAPTGAGMGASMTYGNIMSYYNKFDYGFGAGVELHPVGGWVIGARGNISIGKIYKSMESGQSPAFSSADARNNVVQIYTGWIFGNKNK